MPLPNRLRSRRSSARFAPPLSAGWLILIGVLASLAPGPATAQLASVEIVGPAGSGIFGSSVKALPNGNFVVSDPGYDAPPATDVGAVHLYDGTTLTRIATLTGTTTGDQVGYGDPGIVVLPSGSYVVKSFRWDNGAVVDVGALTFCDGTTGCNGVVSAANSLVGSTASDSVGAYVDVLGTGNFVVSSPVWDNPIGPAIDAGAVTFCSGVTNDCKGPVSGTNSLVGTSADDRVPLYVRALASGHYVVATPIWDNPSPPQRTNAGAVTYCDGQNGCTGPVTASNSLVGTSTNDLVGWSGVLELGDGSYVVGSSTWNKPAPALASAGAATWCPANGGCNGQVVSSANSLTGASAGDGVGETLRAIADGAYVVGSWRFSVPGAGIPNVGAITWCGAGGATCTGAAVTTANSLVGGRQGDLEGPTVVAGKNGSFVVASWGWDDPATLAGDVGAVTWCSAAIHCAGTVVGPTVSLVGSTANDRIGRLLVPLANGNYVVGSYTWDNGAASDAGAVRFCDGALGCVGAVSAANAYVGSTTGDAVGARLPARTGVLLPGIFPLTNGNYVVVAGFWNSGTSPDVGAVRLCDGEVGCVGTPSAANALVGTRGSDGVGILGVTPLANGNFVVRSPGWNLGAGAATWCSGTAGCPGEISPDNSVVGRVANDAISSLAVDALSDGGYLVRSSQVDEGSIIDAGAYTPGSGQGGTVGAVGAANSVFGAVTNGLTSFDYDAPRARFYVGRAPSNTVSIVSVPEPGLEALFLAALALAAVSRRRGSGLARPTSSNE